jgi:hypothetical protein
MARPLPSRVDRCVRTMELMMRRVLIAAILAAFFGCIPAFAQIAGMGSPPPGISATSPFGTGFSGFAADLQSATLPYSGTVNPAPCSTGNLGMAALPTFDGGGISLSTNSAVSELPGPYGVGTSTLAPCNSVSSSGLMSYPSSVTATSTSASASSPSSPSSSSVSSLDAAGAGIAGLGTSGLGTTGLGSLPTMSGSASQATPPSTGVGGSSTFCSGASGGSTTTSTNTDAATSTTNAEITQSGIVRDPAARGVGSGLRDPAQTLAGEASVPATAGVPCMISE